jgi:hypothetical protein
MAAAPHGFDYQAESAKGFISSTYKDADAV